MTGTGLAVEVPERGQVVRCRDRTWAVNEATPSSFRIDPIAGTRPQHLVRASALIADDVGLGKLTDVVRA
jgi:hypothetical protein